MKNFIKNHLLKETWLNESEISVLLNVLANGLKRKNPELESYINKILELDTSDNIEIINLKTKIGLFV